MDLLSPCTNVIWTAYAHVRTEPQCDIGHTRGKKKSDIREVQDKPEDDGLGAPLQLAAGDNQNAL